MRFASHAQMNAEVLILRKSEKHLFPVTFRPNQRFADYTIAQGSFIQVAQHVLTRVQLNRGYLASATGIPLIAIPLDLAQLSHARRLLCSLRQHPPPPPRRRS